MKIILNMLLLSLLMLSCNQEQKTSKSENFAYEYYPDGNLKIETQVLDGKAHGIMKIYTPGGALEKVYTYKLGKKEGPAVEYYINGQLRTKTHFKDNKMEGQTIMYYKSGEVYRTTSYVAGKMEGERNSYYKDGSLMAEAKFKNGFPGLGLKEYSSKGKEVQVKPSILIEPINQLADLNTYVLKMRLSDNQPSTLFYVGELTDGIYLNENCKQFKPSQEGVVSYTLRLNKGEEIKDTYTISARFNTEKGNFGLVSRKYIVSIANR